MSDAKMIPGGRAAITIAPSIGRIVWFFPSIDDGRHADGQPFASMIAGVNDDGSINLLVAARDGSPYGAQNISLLQDGDDVDHDKPHAIWMPYQKGQAAKTEQLGGDVGTRLQAVEKLLETGGTVHTLFTDLAGKVGSQIAELEKSLGERLAAVETRPQPAPASALNAPPALAPEGGTANPAEQPA